MIKLNFSWCVVAFIFLIYFFQSKLFRFAINLLYGGTHTHKNTNTYKKKNNNKKFHVPQFV